MAIAREVAAVTRLGVEVNFQLFLLETCVHVYALNIQMHACLQTNMKAQEHAQLVGLIMLNLLLLCYHFCQFGDLVLLVHVIELLIVLSFSKFLCPL